MAHKLLLPEKPTNFADLIRRIRYQEELGREGKASKEKCNFEELSAFRGWMRQTAITFGKHDGDMDPKAATDAGILASEMKSDSDRLDDFDRFDDFLKGLSHAIVWRAEHDLPVDAVMMLNFIHVVRCINNLQSTETQIIPVLKSLQALLQRVKEQKVEETQLQVVDALSLIFDTMSSSHGCYVDTSPSFARTSVLICVSSLDRENLRDPLLALLGSLKDEHTLLLAQNQQNLRLGQAASYAYQALLAVPRDGATEKVDWNRRRFFKASNDMLEIIGGVSSIEPSRIVYTDPYPEDIVAAEVSMAKEFGEIKYSEDPWAGTKYEGEMKSWYMALRATGPLVFAGRKPLLALELLDLMPKSPRPEAEQQAILDELKFITGEHKKALDWLHGLDKWTDNNDTKVAVLYSQAQEEEMGLFKLVKEQGQRRPGQKWWKEEIWQEEEFLCGLFAQLEEHVLLQRDWVDEGEAAMGVVYEILGRVKPTPIRVQACAQQAALCLDQPWVLKVRHEFKTTRKEKVFGRSSTLASFLKGEYPKGDSSYHFMIAFFECLPAKKYIARCSIPTDGTDRGPWRENWSLCTNEMKGEWDQLFNRARALANLSRPFRSQDSMQLIYRRYLALALAGLVHRLVCSAIMVTVEPHKVRGSTRLGRGSVRFDPNSIYRIDSRYLFEGNADGAGDAILVILETEVRVLLRALCLLAQEDVPMYEVENSLLVRLQRNDKRFAQDW